MKITCITAVLSFMTAFPISATSGCEIYQSIDKKPIRYRGIDFPAYRFTLKDTAGHKLRLQDFVGEWTILYFWTSKSKWSVEGLAEIKKLHDKYEGKVQIIAIDCHDSENSSNSIPSHGLSEIHHVICPDNSKVLKEYAVILFPKMVIINPEGNIVYNRDYDGLGIEDAVDSVVFFD